MELLTTSSRRGALLLACALVVLSGFARAESVPSKEYQIKAAFLFNFVKFIEWPPQAFKAADSPICLGVLGDDPLGSALDEVIRGETVHDRRLVVLRSRRIEDLRGCHLLFISGSEKSNVKDIIDTLGGQPIVTVSDIEGFANNGGVIQFFLDDKKVRFEINPLVAKRLDLRMSAQLLALGKAAGP